MIPAKEIDGELWIRAADVRIKKAAEVKLQMDLRDYFAAQAIPELIGFGNPECGAELAYRWADAMLKEREK